MNDTIRLDPEEALRVANALMKLHDELDGIAIRLRSLQRMISTPESAEEALRRECRRLGDAAEDIASLSRRIRLTAELFEENEHWLVQLLNTQTGVIPVQNRSLEAQLNRSRQKSDTSSVSLSVANDV